MFNFCCSVQAIVVSLKFDRHYCGDLTSFVRTCEEGGPVECKLAIDKRVQQFTINQSKVQFYMMLRSKVTRLIVWTCTKCQLAAAFACLRSLSICFRILNILTLRKRRNALLNGRFGVHRRHLHQWSEPRIYPRA